ncbi:multicilin isoform X2 [Melanotaenia boesemani]|uniref:multicilin isoform X2 n=1 Tax=Melanotaenia boesemani TaxID=1250792 RepID=UPI001C04E191|nr:multicilin isoform X2 [Melanotaenia boesemani]
MELMEMQRDRQRFGEVCLNQMGQHARRAAVSKTDKIPVPRSSSPVNVYVELPCIVDQAFSTIAWDDLEDCAIEVRQEKDSFGPQVNESHPDNHFFGDYTLDYLTETSHLHAQDGASWRCKAEWHGRTLGHSTVFNKQLQETYHRQQEELDSLEERNLHLRQLASRAKHLASVLEKLMTVRNPHAGEPGTPCGDSPSLGPCKRQRLDEGYETESSDSVEDMLRDISTRCNAVLLNSTTGPKQQQESETIRMYGAFSGLQMSTLSDRSVSVDGTETGDSVLSFKTSIREHSTIRTQAFPHGHAFTSRTQQGGYRFRWVPNYN